MKTPVRTSLILLVLLAVVDLGFQSCGHPSPQSGNGVGYESRVPDGQVGRAEPFVYAGTCADPTTPEARLLRAGTVYTLTTWNCVALVPEQAVDPREVEATVDTLVYRGRTFNRETTP